MSTNKLITVFNYLLLLVCILVVGCTRDFLHKNKFDISNPHPRSENKIPIALALMVNDDVCQFTVRGLYPLVEIHIGPVICEKVRNLFSLTFEGVEIVHSTSEAASRKSDAIAHIKIIDASTVSVGLSTPSAGEAVVVLEWSITSLDGKVLYTNTLKGIGRINIPFITLSDIEKECMQRCLNDLMQKLYEDMLTSPAVRKISDLIDSGKPLN